MSQHFIQPAILQARSIENIHGQFRERGWPMPQEIGRSLIPAWEDDSAQVTNLPVWWPVCWISAKLVVLSQMQITTRICGCLQNIEQSLALP